MKEFKLSEKERQQLILGSHTSERLPIFKVESSDIRFCESRGIKPVIFYAFCNIDIDEDDNRHVRQIIDDPRPSYLPKLRDILVALRAQQNIISPGALRLYLVYLEKMRNQELSNLLSDL